MSIFKKGIKGDLKHCLKNIVFGLISNVKGDICSKNKNFYQKQCMVEDQCSSDNDTGENI